MDAPALAPPSTTAPSEVVDEPALAARIDLAAFAENCLVVYGWAVGLAEPLASVTLTVGEQTIELKGASLPVPRPDVGRHFLGRTVAGTDHGFLLLRELAALPWLADTVRLRVSTDSGRSETSDWPLKREQQAVRAIREVAEPGWRSLIARMNAEQIAVLERLASAVVPVLNSASRGEPALVGLDSPSAEYPFCGVLQGGILVAALSLSDAPRAGEEWTLSYGDSRFDLLGAVRTGSSLNPPTEGPSSTSAPRPLELLFATALPDARAAVEREARIVHSGPAGTRTSRVWSCTDPAQCWQRLQQHLASLSPRDRIAACEHLGALIRNRPQSAEALGDAISQQLRSALEQLPVHVDASDPQSRVRLHLDRAIPIDGTGLFLMGWCYADAKARLQLVCCVGEREFNLNEHWARVARPDVTEYLAKHAITNAEEPGFFCLVPLVPERLPCYLRVKTAGRPECNYVALPPMQDVEPALQAVRMVLSMLDPGRRDLRQIMNQHVGPAIGALWATRTPPVGSPALIRVGRQPTDPKVSVIVPLFGRIDLADYQLALFADDPDFGEVELIYVVDDPRLVDEFRHQCAHLWGTHRVAFMYADPGGNLGFAGATNFGARIARAPYLLLLNSDVFPQRPGWLGTMLRTYQAHPDTGILGAKLLYEDGTVQHAGMTSRRNVHWQNLWINHHPYKGMSPAGLSGTREVEAVSAACALIETALYRSLGGLSEDYIIGDFEDSDLCHRVRSTGCLNRVALDVTLYHLERQSQTLGGDGRWRTALTLYNCWLHDQRWSDRIGGGPS